MTQTTGRYTTTNWIPNGNGGIFMLFFRAITVLFLALFTFQTPVNTEESAAVRKAAFGTGIDLSAGDWFPPMTTTDSMGTAPPAPSSSFPTMLCWKKSKTPAHGRLFHRMKLSISSCTAIILMTPKHRNPLCRPSKRGITC